MKERKVKIKMGGEELGEEKMWKKMVNTKDFFVLNCLFLIFSKFYVY